MEISTEKNKNLTIKKASALIQTNAKELSLTQRKIINLFIYVAQKEGNKEEYCLPTTTVKKICGITRKGNDDLKEQLRSLMGIIIEFNYLGKDSSDWEASTLVSSAKIKKGSKFTEFEFSKCLKEKILSPNMYVPLNIVLIANLKSTYSIILYEFLKDYLTSPAVPVLTIEKFRSLLGITDKKYCLFQNFKVRVLDTAVSEINEKTDIHCSYALIKTHGNKYSQISFSVRENKQQKLLRRATLPERNNLHLFFDPSTLPKEVLEVLPKEYQINSIYHQIEPYFDDLAFLVSNIEYSNKNCKENYPAYLKLALKNDYAKVNREVKEKKGKIVQEKKDHIQEKKNQEKLLKQKAWDYFNSLPEGEQFKFRSDAEEKMSAALKFIKIPEGRKDIINAQIEKDMFAELKQGRKI